MTIIEARELAMQGKTVIDRTGKEWSKKDFNRIEDFHCSYVFGEWREKKEPRRVYATINKKEEINGYYPSHEEASEYVSIGERIVEFVEVVK
jgi:hypothetical protein